MAYCSIDTVHISFVTTLAEFVGESVHNLPLPFTRAYSPLQRFPQTEVGTVTLCLSWLNRHHESLFAVICVLQ